MVAGIYQVGRVAIEMHMLQSSHAYNIWICSMESTSRANMLLYDVHMNYAKMCQIVFNVFLPHENIWEFQKMLNKIVVVERKTSQAGYRKELD